MGEFELDTPIRVHRQGWNKPYEISVKELIDQSIDTGHWEDIAKRHGLDADADEFNLRDHVDVLTMEDISDMADDPHPEVGHVFNENTWVGHKPDGEPLTAQHLDDVLEFVTTPEAAIKVAKRHGIHNVKVGSDLEQHLHELEMEDLCILTGDPNTELY